MKIFVLLFTTSLYAADNGPVSSKVFVDSDGDKIKILDAELRNKLRSNKEITANHLYDNEAGIEKFKSDLEKNVLTEKKSKYGIYVTVAGDQPDTISQKIYGTPTRWKEIQLLNEMQLDGSAIKVGTKLKYIIDERELKNDSQNRKNSNH